MKGIIYLLLAEMSFALSSAIGKYILIDSDIYGIQITFLRFAFGFIFGYWGMKHSGISFTPIKKWPIFLRAVFNTISAMLFFYSLKFTTVTNANMLGNSYPIWVVLFAPLFIHEKYKKSNILFLVVAIVGVYLVMNPDFGHVNKGDLVAFISGITSSVAVLSLRQARKNDRSELIIFYLMGTGFVVNGLFMLFYWAQPTFTQWIYLCISAILGLAGQWFVTVGYKYIEASKGSLISTSRVLFAGSLGVIWFNDQITFTFLLGTSLILSAQMYILYSNKK